MEDHSVAVSAMGKSQYWSCSSIIVGTYSVCDVPNLTNVTNVEYTWHRRSLQKNSLSGCMRVGKTLVQSAMMSLRTCLSFLSKILQIWPSLQQILWSYFSKRKYTGTIILDVMSKEHSENTLRRTYTQCPLCNYNSTWTSLKLTHPRSLQICCKWEIWYCHQRTAFLKRNPIYGTLIRISEKSKWCLRRKLRATRTNQTERKRNTTTVRKWSTTTERPKRRRTTKEVTHSTWQRKKKRKPHSLHPLQES